MRKLKLFRPLPGAVLILAVYWTLLFIATHLPSVPKVDAPRHTDKLVHFAGYAGLTFLAAVVYFRRRRWSLPAALLILGAAMVYGVADELMQIPIPRRSADVLDWICDSLGAAAGLIAFRVVQKTLQLVWRDTSCREGRHTECGATLRRLVGWSRLG